MSVFNVVMLEKSCSRTYVDPKIDRIPSAYFFMFSYTLARAFHVLKINRSGFGRFLILLRL